MRYKKRKRSRKKDKQMETYLVGNVGLEGN